MNNVQYVDEHRSDRILGFLCRALELGYSYDEAWDLFLNSTQGKGIQENDPWYIEHLQGRPLAEKADRELGHNYKKMSNIDYDFDRLEALVYLIEMAHSQYNIDYQHIFSKMSLSEFMKECEVCIGDYDNKLIKIYLI